MVNSGDDDSDDNHESVGDSGDDNSDDNHESVGDSGGDGGRCVLMRIEIARRMITVDTNAIT